MVWFWDFPPVEEKLDEAFAEELEVFVVWLRGAEELEGILGPELQVGLEIAVGAR
jgi:hypothetical protein